MSEPEKLVIGRDDLADPRVDEALAAQMSYGMGGPAPPVADKPSGLLYRPWFALTLAGALGAFLAWAMLEPVFEDGVAFKGNVTAVEPTGSPLLSGELDLSGSATVSGIQVWFFAGRSPVIRDGQAGPPGSLHVGDAVLVRGEPMQLPGVGQVVLATQAVVREGDQARYPTPDLAALGWRSLLVGLAIFPLIAALVGLFVGATDGILSRATHRATLCGLVGLGCGLGLGLVADLFAEVLYAVGGIFVERVNTGQGAHMSTAAFLVQMMNRGLAWAVAGAAMGLGQGIALRSTKLLVNGLIGGMTGALLGGLLFDPIYYLVQGDLVGGGGAEVSRAVGFVIIGAATGFMIGVVELLAREAWCKMLTGPLAGKEFAIYRDPTVVGSSPKSEIFLFKDAEVEPRHALIHTMGEGYEIEDQGSGAGTWVNGRRVKRQRLAHGDQIRIGKTVFSFSVKDG